MKPIIKADAVPTIFKREPPQTKKVILKIKAWQITIITLPQNSENKHQGLYFSKAFFEVLIFGGSYIWREICVSKSVRLILGGKFASQNRLGHSLQFRRIMGGRNLSSAVSTWRFREQKHSCPRCKRLHCRLIGLGYRWKEIYVSTL